MSVWVGGHRGSGCTDHARFAGRDPRLPAENSLESVARAFAEGADFVEIDAAVSADGQVFVLHNVVPGDHFFGEKPTAPLNTLRWRDFRDLAIGRNGNGRVCLLAEMLALIATKAPRGRPFAVNIELKGAQKAGQPWDGEGFLDAVAKVVADSPVAVEKVLFSSFALRNVIGMAGRLPKAQYGMVFTPSPIGQTLHIGERGAYDVKALPFRIAHVERCAALFSSNVTDGAKLSRLHPEAGTLSDKTLRTLGAKGWAFTTWGLFERLTEARRAHYLGLIAAAGEAGVDLAVITDEVAAMRGLVTD
jgi:glycerophosphoryl diester phosphodiesterase